LQILVGELTPKLSSDNISVYRSVIVPKLDYGSVLYGFARKSYLSKLEPVAIAAI